MRDGIRFQTIRQLMAGGPRPVARPRDKPPLPPRVLVYLALTGGATLKQVAYTLGIADGAAKRALEGLCNQGLVRRRTDGAYEAVPKEV